MPREMTGSNDFSSGMLLLLAYAIRSTANDQLCSIHQPVQHLSKLIKTTVSTSFWCAMIPHSGGAVAPSLKLMHAMLVTWPQQRQDVT